RLPGYVSVDVAIVKNFGNITNSSQQSICYSRCATRPLGNFVSAGRVHRHPKNICRPVYDYFQISHWVEVQMKRNPEAPPQRRTDETGPGRGTHQCELRELELYRSR